MDDLKESDKHQNLSGTNSYWRSLWMDCEYLQNCDRGKLRLSEERFWDELIDKYLTVG